MEKGYLYIIQSQKDRTYYIGHTSNLQRRLIQHNQGYVKSTKGKRPYSIVFSAVFPSLKVARDLERRIKRWKRKDFIEKIIKERKIIVGP